MMQQYSLPYNRQAQSHVTYNPIVDQSDGVVVPIGSVTEVDDEHLNRCGRCFERLLKPTVSEIVSVVFDVFIMCLIEQQLRDRLADSTSVLGRMCLLSAAEGIVYLLFLLAFDRCQMNPLLTIGCMFSGVVGCVLGIVLIIAQLIGAISGVLLHQIVTIDAYAVLPKIITQQPDNIPHENSNFFDDFYFLKASYQFILCQAIATFVLVLLYLINSPSKADTCAHECSHKHRGIRDAASLALTVLVCTFLSKLNSSASWNPMRSFAVSLVTSARASMIAVPTWRYHIVFWLGPFIGSLFASFLFRLIFADKEHRITPCSRRH